VKVDIFVNMPNRPRGDDVEIPGLGIFVNGEHHTVDPDQVKRAREAGYPLDAMFDDNDEPVDTVIGDPDAELPELGPTEVVEPIAPVEDGGEV
jgi:hypothetical protein